VQPVRRRNEQVSGMAAEGPVMRRFVTLSCLCAIVLGSASAVGQQPDERVEVRMMLIDVLATDQAGSPVRGLARDEFQVTVRGTIKPIDTFDAICGTEGLTASAATNRIVLAYDYRRLTQPDRMRVLEGAADLLREQKKTGEQVMIVSLTDMLRVEQRFTSDLEQLLDTLERMEYDSTLGTRQFAYVSDKEYFENIATLFDVLAAYDGSKAVVLYSATVTAPDANDGWFRDLTTRAAVGRSVVYPAGLRGLKTETPRSGERLLARLARDTGGRVGDSGVEASKLYDEIRRELGCRYSLGFYLDPDRSHAPEDVIISVPKRGVNLHYPAQVRLWSEAETRESRQRAAFADPAQFENPLVRAVAYPVGPDSPKTWSVLVAIHAPLPIGPERELLDISAELYRGGRKVEDFFRRMEFEPPATGAGVQPFTLFGEASVKKGEHELRVVLSRPGEKQVVASSARFDVPEVPWGELILRGPLLARVEEEGLALRADETVGVLLRETIGDQSFEPLAVHEIRPTDTLLMGWQACRVKAEDRLEYGARIDRRIVDLDGNPVHRLSSIPLNLEGDDKVECHRGLDKVEPGTLGTGKYMVEVAVIRAGERVLEQSAPLLVD
jgi:VWFA-related protein